MAAAALSYMYPLGTYSTLHLYFPCSRASPPHRSQSFRQQELVRKRLAELPICLLAGSQAICYSGPQWACLGLANANLHRLSGKLMRVCCPIADFHPLSILNTSWCAAIATPSQTKQASTIMPSPGSRSARSITRDWWIGDGEGIVRCQLGLLDSHLHSGLALPTTSQMFAMLAVHTTP